VKFVVALSSFLCFFVLSSCIQPAQEKKEIWKTDRIRNGSVSYYAIFDEKNRNISQQWNHIFYEAGRIVLVREIIGGESEEILRIAMNKISLQPESVEIRDSIETEQNILFKGNLKNRAYITENLLENQTQRKQYYLGKDTFIEHEALIFLMAAYPFGELNRVSVRSISTRLNLDSQVSIEFVGKETIEISGVSYETYRLYFPTMDITSWYMEDEPHILIQSTQGPISTRLLNWNGI